MPLLVLFRNITLGAAVVLKGSTLDLDMAAEGVVNPSLGKEYSRLDCRAKGSLEDYTYSEDALSMTVQRCFLFCTQQRSAMYFALEGGSKCLCAPLFLGRRLADPRCNTPCEGNPSQKCGGAAALEVYMIFGCGSTTTTTTADMYLELAGQSCGTLPELDAGEHQALPADHRAVVGSKKACKDVCMNGVSGLTCAGFTWDGDRSHCEFKGNVTSGVARKSSSLSCIYKSFPSPTGSAKRD